MRLLERIQLNNSPVEEMYRTRYVGKGTEFPGMSPSHNFGVFTSLEVLQTLLLKVFMEIPLHMQDWLD